MLEALKTGGVVGISHITGGGFYENIPRCLPEGVTARIEKSSIPTPAIFRLIQEMGKIAERDMFNTFNMGVGMVAAVSKEQADKALEVLKANGEDAVVLGEVIEGSEGVVFA